MYKNKYDATVQKARTLVKVFTLSNNKYKPEIINIRPRNEAVERDIFFVGKTLYLVLSILASVSTSIMLLKIEDPEEHNKVPKSV